MTFQYEEPLLVRFSSADHQLMKTKLTILQCGAACLLIISAFLKVSYFAFQVLTFVALKN